MILSQDTVSSVADSVLRRLPFALAVPVEASGRHVHLSRADADVLFGKGYELTPQRELSQPGQYLCKERVSIKGPKGTMSNVALLGPVRNKTQVEISKTDAAVLGVDAPVKESGYISGSCGVTIIAGNRECPICEGVIIAMRHLHATPNDAKCLGVIDGERVSIRVDGERPVIFEEVAVRVSDKFSTTMHIDYDEANACGHAKGTMGYIVR